MALPQRLGEAGGSAFAYWFSRCGPGESDEHGSIVYAPTMAEAMQVYAKTWPHEPYSIRQMADNE